MNTLKTITGRQIVDRTGEVFGRLTVLNYNAEKHSETRCVHWKCQCDCGNIKSIAISSLARGLTKSCGCLNKEEQNCKRIDLKGKTFGYYKVLDYDKRISLQKGRSYWLCECICGNVGVVEGYSLRSGDSKSCGCRR